MATLKKFDEFINEGKVLPGPGEAGSRGYQIDDDILNMIQSGEIKLHTDYTIEDNTIWIWDNNDAYEEIAEFF
jgi:hypothetical protein